MRSKELVVTAVWRSTQQARAVMVRVVAAKSWFLVGWVQSKREIVVAAKRQRAVMVAAAAKS